MMSTYVVFSIEPPVSPSQLIAYRTLRLASLQMDPQAFGSNYVRELAFPEDVWRERLDSCFKQTFVASVLDVSYASEHGDIENMAAEKGEWVGTASIAGPSTMPPFVLAQFKEAGVGANWEIYGLYGMWIHPTHRSKGVGSQLVKACLEWARTNVDTRFSLTSEHASGGDFRKVVVLSIYDDNVAGHEFYTRTGFTDLKGVSSRDGEKWMMARVHHG